jgi:hypothetical protein
VRRYRIELREHFISGDVNLASELEISVRIAPGEFFDRYTILRIKHLNISDRGKLDVIRRELTEVSEQYGPLFEQVTDKVRLESLVAGLLDINKELWQIEDEIRECEKNEDFGQKFIQLARAVYLTNDRRAKVKREISDLFGAQTYEVKSYV